MASEWKAAWRPKETDYLVSCVDDRDAPVIVVRPMRGWRVDAGHTAQRIVEALSTECAGDAERLAEDLTEAHATIATQRAEVAALRLLVETLTGMVRRCAHATAAEPVLAAGILAELATIESRGVAT